MSQKKPGKMIIPFVLSFFVFALFIKTIFVGVETDEQYPLLLTKKLMSGAVMLKDCFEIHQTSALFMVPFLTIKHFLTNSSNYDIIFLRICSAMMLLITSFLTYKTARKYQSREMSFLIALLTFSYLPKYYLTMDYSILQYVFLIWIGLIFTNNNEIPFTEWKNTEYIKLGICAGLLTFAYPLFIIFPLCFVFMFKTKSWKVYASAFMTIPLFFLCKGGIDISFIGNIFSDASHAVPFAVKISNNLTRLWQLIPPVIFVLIWITFKEKDVKGKNKMIAIFSVIGAITFAIITFATGSKISYNGIWILFFIMLAVSGKVPVYVYFSLSILLMQFLAGNQQGLMFARYIYPSILPLLILTKDKIDLKIPVICMTIISALPLFLTTQNFQNKQSEFIRCETGDCKGIYADEMTIDKLQEVSNYYKDRSGTFLLMDSSASLYDETSLKPLCPNMIDTPVFDRSFLTYYDQEGYPDYIYYVPGCNFVSLSDDFKQMIKDNYHIDQTLGYGYCLSRN